VDARRVVHHTFLERRGGAARVAALLGQGQREQGGAVEHCFEVAETHTGNQTQAERPWRQALSQAASVPSGDCVLHLHSTADWPGLLELCSPARTLVVTLHDASLVTGGCPYPLDCPHFELDCRDPCPRGYPSSEARRRGLRVLVQRAGPLLVSPSRWLQRIVQTALPGAAVALAANGVEWPEQLPGREEVRSRLGIAAAARLCVFVAHGGEKAVYKAGDHWQNYWSAIKAQAPEAVGFFVGGERHERQGKDDAVFWPYVEQEQLRAFFRAADLFLYPTLADNHPLLVLEAMASGCATLAYAVGGIPEQIQDGRTGALVRPGDVASFVATAASLLKDRRRARALGEEGRRVGKTRFASTHMVEAYAKLYAGWHGGGEYFNLEKF